MRGMSTSKLPRRLFFVCCLFLIVSAASAQSLKVSLDVAGPEEPKGKIFSTLVADLAQRGVSLVGSGTADYQIKIIVVNLESKGRGAGYAVSVAVIAPRPGHGFRRPLVAHFLEVSPPKGLADLCKRVADGINSDVFDVHRRSPAE